MYIKIHSVSLEIDVLSSANKTPKYMIRDGLLVHLVLRLRDDIAIPTIIIRFLLVTSPKESIRHDRGGNFPLHVVCGQHQQS